jgi:cis-L-3-hydroxyproline dehydratase
MVDGIGSAIRYPLGAATASIAAYPPFRATRSASTLCAMSRRQWPARNLTAGAATGPLLHANTGLSFWGGVDPETGMIIDRSHPLLGQCITGRILAIPSGRGSCSASGVLIELIRNGRAPAGIVMCEQESILPLAVMMAEEVLGAGLPVALVEREAFAALATSAFAAIGEGLVRADSGPVAPPGRSAAAGPDAAADTALALSPRDRDDLAGRNGPARAAAMRVITRVAAMEGASELLDVACAHLDCCIYTGPSSIEIARHFAALGGRFAVPTTLNAISADLRPGAAPSGTAALGEATLRQAEAYLAMGAEASFTCAPYLRDEPPTAGQHVGWAESNAVLYANSVLGARTQKYPDYLDLCVALTGRAPLAGCHTDAGRKAVERIDLTMPAGADESFWPLAGLAVGKRAPHGIPVVAGLERTSPTPDDLKAFCAAFATTSAAPMVHLAGITPEAPSVAAALGVTAPLRRAAVTRADLSALWSSVNAGTDAIGLVALGNPHLSEREIRALHALLDGRTVRVPVIVTTARAVLDPLARDGTMDRMTSAGVRFIADTCWCMLGEPVVPPAAGAVMTNSGKYAHYGPGLTGAGYRFGSLADCVEAACVGRIDRTLPSWLA